MERDTNMKYKSLRGTNSVAQATVRRDWQLIDSEFPRGSFTSEAILTTVSLKCSNNKE